MLLVRFALLLSPLLAAAASCVSWRQTGGCDPFGPREEGGDAACTKTVPKGASGFCECSLRGDGEAAGFVGCDHEPFTW